MPGDNLGLYLLATLLICLSPGPNVMLMISFGLHGGRGAVWRGVAGVTTATAIFLLVAAAGLLAVLAASDTLFTLIRYAGAAYLVYLGVRLLLGSLRPAKAFPAPASRAGGAFWQGFVTQLSNPKAVLFWSALLPQFVDQRRPLALQVVTLGLMAVAIDVLVLGSYGLVALVTRRTLVGSRATSWLDATAGVLFTATGLLLALAHRGAGTG